MSDFCSECGTSVADADNFCGNCGAQISNATTRGKVPNELSHLPTNERLDACVEQLKFLQKSSELSIEVGDLFNEFISHLRPTVTAGSEIATRLSNRGLSGNVTLTPSNDEIGENVTEYIHNRDRSLRSLESLKGVRGKLEQLEPRPEFELTHQHYNKWLELFNTILSYSRQIIEGLQIGYTVEGDNLIVDYQGMSEVYSKGGTVFGDEMHNLRRTIDKWEKTAKKFERSGNNDNNIINEYIDSLNS